MTVIKKIIGEVEKDLSFFESEDRDNLDDSNGLAFRIASLCPTLSEDKGVFTLATTLFNHLSPLTSH